MNWDFQSIVYWLYNVVSVENNEKYHCYINTWNYVKDSFGDIKI